MLHVIDLHKVTITPACNPKVRPVFMFADRSPSKDELLKAIDLQLPNLESSVRHAEKSPDAKLTITNAKEAVEHMKLCRELVAASSDMNGFPQDRRATRSLTIRLAGTVLGIIQIEVDELWKFE